MGIFIRLREGSVIKFLPRIIKGEEMLIKCGYAPDWTGQSSKRYWIIDETISGKYVVQDMPIKMQRLDNSCYLTQSLTGLHLKDKAEFTSVKEEELEVS